MKVSETSPSHQTHLRWDKKNALVGLAILIILIAGGILFILMREEKSESAPTVPQYGYEKLNDEVDKKLGQNDLSGALKLVKGQKTIDEPRMQQLLAATYANVGNYKKAVEVYKTLSDQNKLGAIAAASAGEIAVLADDKQSGIDFLNEAIELTRNSKEPNRDELIATYQSRIKDLEKQ